MENVVFLFPLLLLPVNALKNVLRTMEMMDVLMFSFCSKVSKNHVKSLKWKADFCSLHLLDPIELKISFRFPRGYNIIQIELTYFSFLLRCPKPTEVRINTSHGATFSAVQKDSEEKHFYNRKRTGGELIRHFLDISNISEINRSQVGFHHDHYDENIYYYAREIYKGLKVKKLLCENVNIPDYYRIVNLILPKVFLHGISPSLEISRKLLIQNFEYFRMEHETSVTSLDTLLMANCRNVRFSCRQFTDKDFNRFLKLWIKKANTQLETILFSNSKDRVMEDILKGIPSRRMDERREKIAPMWKSVVVRDGYVINRSDGIEATISIETEHNDAIVFAVWNQF
ncbi:hypothetical protein CAEBREN_16025 [Caenorhabditis brenneri]|uniref:F-box domain-containing protein n=1 Tax=Caenorhabditis brenneri TaxID=135651 RepID=G0N3H7_CAEBE|nr:hypothetical protein CAEBREN_16025 [Caenorhabditis brenneri]